MKKTSKITMDKIKLMLMIGAIFSFSTTLQAVQTSYYNSGGISDGLYYKIGGGSVIASNFTYHRPQTVGMGIRWNANLMCGNFDLNSTISNQLNGVTDGFNDVMGSLLSNATGAVASLPALIIQRANPQLYDLLTNGVLQGKLDFSDIKMSCKQMANKMADYADDAGLVQAAKAENWTNMLNGRVDAVRAEKTVENEGGSNGLTWIGGQVVGGRNDPPINVTADITKAGYNLLLNRNVTDSSLVSNPVGKGNIYTTWTSPADAQDWIIDVIGERTYTVDDPNANNSKPGRGLNSKIQEYYEEYYNNLVDLVNGTTTITDSSLAGVKGGGVSVSRGTIESLQADDERAMLVDRLASEIAFSRVMEEMLMARRLLLAGKKEPNAAKNLQVQTMIESQIKELDEEFYQMKLEAESRKWLNGNTLTEIANRNVDRQKGVTLPNAPDANQPLLKSIQ